MRWKRRTFWLLGFSVVVVICAGAFLYVAAYLDTRGIGDRLRVGMTNAEVEAIVRHDCAVAHPGFWPVCYLEICGDPSFGYSEVWDCSPSGGVLIQVHYDGAGKVTAFRIPENSTPAERLREWLGLETPPIPSAAANPDQDS